MYSNCLEIMHLEKTIAHKIDSFQLKLNHGQELTVFSLCRAAKIRTGSDTSAMIQIKTFQQRSTWKLTMPLTRCHHAKVARLTLLTPAKRMRLTSEKGFVTNDRITSIDPQTQFSYSNLISANNRRE